MKAFSDWLLLNQTVMEEHPKRMNLAQLVQAKDDPILKKLTEKAF